jgi:hypothetical protein
VSPEKIASINAHLQTLPSKHIQYLNEYKGTLDSGVPMSDYFVPGQPLFAFPSQDGKALLINLPVTTNVAGAQLANNKPVLTAMIKTIRADMSAWATSNGFVSHVTGIGALLSDLF